MNLQVIVQSDAGAQRTELYPASGLITIGRHPQCSLRLDSDLVSRQHAVVSAGNGAVRVEDVSTNGTIAGDLLLRRDAIEVPYGTPIVVGDFTVFVYAVDHHGNQVGSSIPMAPHGARQLGPTVPPPMGGRPSAIRSPSNVAPSMSTG